MKIANIQWIDDKVVMTKLELSGESNKGWRGDNEFDIRILWKFRKYPHTIHMYAVLILNIFIIHE